METLQLKHLASYLYYDLKVKHTTFYDGKTKTIIDNLETLSKECASFQDGMDYYFDDPSDNECEFKPILFPLSALTKEITVNGESFVPIKKLFELHHCGMRIEERLQCFSLNKNKIKYDDFNCAITDGVNIFGYSNYGGFQAIDIDEFRDYTVINQLELLTKLFEWKIDVFQLIDKNLAEPVTDDFNPYK